MRADGLVALMMAATLRRLRGKKRKLRSPQSYKAVQSKRQARLAWSLLEGTRNVRVPVQEEGPMTNPEVRSYGRCTWPGM